VERHFFSLWAFYAFARKVNPKLQWLSAVVLAVIGVLSPPMMWWFTISNWTAVAGPLIGLVCFLEGRRRWSALLWSLLGGYVVGSTLAVGYPAFSLVVGLCAGLILSGKILGSDFLGWRISAFFLGTFATGFVFYLSNSASVKLMIGTIYPGNRISSSGEDSVIRALGGPFSYYLDNDAAGVQPALSASLYIFTLGTLILLFGLARRRRSGQPSQSETLPKLSRSTWLGLTGALAAFVLISGWAFGFVPNVIGHLIGFGRVPGPRTVMGFVVIELALGAMAIEMSGSTSEMRPIPGFIGIGNVRSNRVFGLLSPAVAAVVVVMSVGMVLRGQVGANLLSGRNVVLYSVLTACCVAVFVGAQRQLVRLAPTLVLSIFLSAWVHPLSIGLGSADVLSLKAAQLARDQIGTKPITWIANDDVRLSALTLESGNRTLSGPYFVPDLALWKLLDPTNSAKSAWNRFAHVVFKLKGGDGETSNPVISAPQLDVVVVEMGVCNPKLAELGVTNVLSTSTIEASCIQHMNNVATTRLWVWGLSSKSQL
jgi:hypothetical protein